MRSFIPAGILAVLICLGSTSACRDHLILQSREFPDVGGQLEISNDDSDVTFGLSNLSYFDVENSYIYIGKDPVPMKDGKPAHGSTFPYHFNIVKGQATTLMSIPLSHLGADCKADQPLHYSFHMENIQEVDNAERNVFAVATGVYSLCCKRPYGPVKHEDMGPSMGSADRAFNALTGDSPSTETYKNRPGCSSECPLALIPIYAACDEKGADCEHACQSKNFAGTVQLKGGYDKSDAPVLSWDLSCHHKWNFVDYYLYVGREPPLMKADGSPDYQKWPFQEAFRENQCTFSMKIPLTSLAFSSMGGKAVKCGDTIYWAWYSHANGKTSIDSKDSKQVVAQGKGAMRYHTPGWGWYGSYKVCCDCSGPNE